MFELPVPEDESANHSFAGNTGAIVEGSDLGGMPALEVEEAVLEGVTSLALATSTLDEAIWKLTPRLSFST